MLLQYEWIAGIINISWILIELVVSTFINNYHCILNPFQPNTKALYNPQDFSIPKFF